MTRTTLPSPDNADLLVTFRSESGKFIGFEWKEESNVIPSEKAALIAKTKASIFPNGFLDLASLIAVQARHYKALNDAVSAVSAYEEKNGFADTPAKLALERVVDIACDSETRAADLVAAYPSNTGQDLAAKIVALVGGHKLDDVRFVDRLGLRADAARILAHASN